MDDDPATQNPGILLEIALCAAKIASGLDLSLLSKRLSAPPFYPDIWPGEHYKLLAGIARTLSPRQIVEIGTGSGLSALALLAGLPSTSKLFSFDTLHWRENPQTVLTDLDFADGRLMFSTDDLSDTLLMAPWHQILSETELFIIDAPKDGITEQRILTNLSTIPFKKPPILIFDDIRLMNMIGIWRSIRYPKLDVTSFGHWSGTGLVLLC